MKMEVTVCNVCKAVDRSTLEYEVRQGRRHKTLDLCEEHAAPFESYLSNDDHRSTTSARSGKPRRQSRTPTLTTEELEARLRKTKRAAKVG